MNEEADIKYFVNLTNGIEAIPDIPKDYAFIRIQSTACEQKLWDKIILELDYNFLMSVATGYKCVVVDFGARKQVPRAVYQGLSFIEYVLWKHWYKIEKPSKCRNTNCTAYFKKVYSELNKQTRKKLDYFKPYLLGTEVNIDYRTTATEHDGDKEYFREILLKECNK